MESTAAVSSLMPADDSAALLQHFATHGWVRIVGAFTADEAAAMRDVVWRALEETGIRRDDPATWRIERPAHLQHLKSDPVFRAVGSARTIEAIDRMLEGQTWRMPGDWGAFFVVFPSARLWTGPLDGWHLDADYTGPLSPPKGLKVHAMFGDVATQCGGMLILSGSHRLVHRWFLEHPAPRRAQRGVTEVRPISSLSARALHCGQRRRESGTIPARRRGGWHLAASAREHGDRR